MERIKTRTAEMWKDENDLFWTKILPVVEMDTEDVADNLLVTRSITGDLPHLKMLDSRTNWKITPEAQAYFKKEDIPGKTIARAVLLNSVADKIMKGFLVKLYKQNIPLKFFISEPEAIKWLLEFKK